MAITDNEIKKLMLSYNQMIDKYQELHEIGYEYPYFYEITKDNKHLFYVGARHVFDPSDSSIEKIKSYWHKFLEVTNKSNCVVMIEGGYDEIEESEDKAIRNGGEASLLIYLSAKEGITWYSPEPEYSEELTKLRTKFSDDEVLYQRFATSVAQWFRLVEPKPKLETYIARTIEKDVELMNIKFDVSLENFAKIHNKTHDHEFSLNTCQQQQNCFYLDSNPSENAVSAESSNIRNIHIAKEVIKQWEDNKSIFIIFGSGHAIVHEPAFKKLLN